MDYSIKQVLAEYLQGSYKGWTHNIFVARYYIAKKCNVPADRIAVKLVALDNGETTPVIDLDKAYVITVSRDKAQNIRTIVVRLLLSPFGRFKEYLDKSSHKKSQCLSSDPALKYERKRLCSPKTEERFQLSHSP
jgi:hypothetical protein